ncbi:hypothetical protein RF679_00655 [Undibacterium cyanobacteriorum]|uniref:Uncharacterized protein n=1 Tax=Undibacterium cyanobacteriorum TaxID=3073561 RepID=A0ABY9RJF7_9BURK|nr:hypothetical protein [Undibacterium sp. 20NA77.5]WMW80805.1 hypothetical protein RF679_00655 [Undibacterium sp. 20NA77.5]
MIQKNSPTVIEWAKHMGLPTRGQTWSLVFCFSTADNDAWLHARDQLRKEDLRLALSIPSYGHWCVDLRRHDGEFVVQWRPYDDLRIESSSRFYRDEFKWPRLESLFDFSQFMSELQACLKIEFIGGAHISSPSKFDLKPWLAQERTKLAQWLGPGISLLNT